MFNTHARVHVIKHIHTSTMYGINNDTIFCFHNKSHAKHVLRSLAKYKTMYKRNPDPNKLCLYNSDELLNNISKLPSDIGLFIKDENFESLLLNLSQRNIGICIITGIEENKERDTMNVRYIRLNPYDYTYEDTQREILERDYLL